jgi:hypothetical protein
MKKALIFLLLLPAFGFSDVAVTAYNDNLGVIRETRPFELKEGSQTLRFQDVAAQIDPTSVALLGPEGFQVLEQNYDYDLVSSDVLLQKYIGQSLSGVDKTGKAYEGRLFSFDGSQLVLGLKDGGLQMLNRSELVHLDFPDLPGGLILKPTLVWKVKSPLSGENPLTLTYMTTGLSWHCEYVAKVSPDEKKLDLNGWVSLDNQSGASYREAKLKLVAGDVNRVQEPPRPMMMKAMAALPVADGGSEFQEKSFFEYHLYTLQHPTDLMDKQVKQVELLQAVNVPVAKKYTYDGSRDAKKVSVTLELENKETNGMGMPLPAGKIRVYKADTDKTDQFIGEDAIDHTPKDEKVRVSLGNAFDIVGERKVMAVRRAGSQTNEQDIEITLKNHKKEDVQVVVTEHAWGDWHVTKKSQDFRKKDAYTLEFNVPVPADGTATVTYTIHTGTLEGPQPVEGENSSN